MKNINITQSSCLSQGSSNFLAGGPNDRYTPNPVNETKTIRITIAKENAGEPVSIFQ